MQQHIATIWRNEASSMNFLYVCRPLQGSPLEAHAIQYFVEDRSVGQLGYGEFLASFHKAVLSK